jgi:hypothetical protein
MGLIGYPETSVTNYNYTLRNKPEQHSSQLLCGEGLKSRIGPIWYVNNTAVRKKHPEDGIEHWRKVRIEELPNV